MHPDNEDVPSPQDSGDGSEAEAGVTGEQAPSETVPERLAAIEARLDALAGRVDAVESADDRIERRADAALAAVERLEGQIETDGGSSPAQPPTGSQTSAHTNAAPAPATGDTTEPPSSGTGHHSQAHDTQFEWAAPSESQGHSDRPNDKPTRGDREHGTGGQRQANSRFGSDHPYSAHDEQAPTATSGPTQRPDERGLVDRLRDRL